MVSGTLTHAPADVIRNLIIDLGDGTAPSDASAWPVYVATEPNAPDNVITITDTTPVIQGHSQINGEVQENYGVQIRLRANDFHEGQEKARAIAVALDAATLKTVRVGDVAGTGDESYTVMSVTRISGPLSLGKNVTTSKLNVFTINYTVAMQQVL